MHWHPQGVSPDVARQGEDGHCRARRSVVRIGLDWRGKARTANGSTEGFGLPYCSFGSRCGLAWRGMLRHVAAGHGTARTGTDCEAQV